MAAEEGDYLHMYESMANGYHLSTASEAGAPPPISTDPLSAVLPGDSSSETDAQAELGYRLYDSLEQTGVLHTLRAHMRTRLITELQESGKLPKRPQHPNLDLAQHIILSLIVQHLKAQKYSLATSVLLPECGLASVDKVHFALRIASFAMPLKKRDSASRRMIY